MSRIGYLVIAVVAAIFILGAAVSCVVWPDYDIASPRHEGQSLKPDLKPAEDSATIGSGTVGRDNSTGRREHLSVANQDDARRSEVARDDVPVLDSPVVPANERKRYPFSLWMLAFSVVGYLVGLPRAMGDTSADLLEVALDHVLLRLGHLAIRSKHVLEPLAAIAALFLVVELAMAGESAALPEPLFRVAIVTFSSLAILPTPLLLAFGRLRAKENGVKPSLIRKEFA